MSAFVSMSVQSEAAVTEPHPEAELCSNQPHLMTPGPATSFKQHTRTHMTLTNPHADPKAGSAQGKLSRVQAYAVPGKSLRACDTVMLFVP